MNENDICDNIENVEVQRCLSEKELLYNGKILLIKLIRFYYRNIIYLVLILNI